MLCKICDKDFKNLSQHLKKHNIEPSIYYHEYIKESNEIPKCKECGSELRFIKLSKPYGNFCSRICKDKNHIKKMKSLHNNGIYKNTSHFIKYNKTKTHSDNARKNAIKRRLDKNSNGFNSEYSDRIRNKDNIIKRFGEYRIRYLYLFEFENKVKLGSTHDIKRRISTLNPINILYIGHGKTIDIASIECELFIEFLNYTILDESNKYYTEYLEKCVSDSIIKKIQRLM